MLTKFLKKRWGWELELLQIGNLITTFISGYMTQLFESKQPHCENVLFELLKPRQNLIWQSLNTKIVGNICIAKLLLLTNLKDHQEKKGGGGGH